MSEASDESPQSPSISEVSCASNVSRDVNDFEDCFESATRYGNANIEGHSTTSSDEAAIPPRASVHMLQSGCLPGDTVSVQVAINIGKHFRNPQGIILTLYRECHIDIHPAIPLGSWQNGSKEEYEDYYPKSRTGLGGLSLSSGGTSRVFRQDISQKTTALYVDKRTLTATVKASVHVPDGVFPTISTVPGKMIDFKYYVETIIDLRGKSAIQERILPRLSMVNAVSSFSPSESGLCPHGTYESENLRLDSGLAFLDTSQLRREKGVVTHIAEVIVGTRDSRRRRLKKIDHGQAHGEPPTESLQDYTSSTNDDVDHDLRENGRFFHYDIDDLHPNLDDQLEALQAVDFAPAQDVPAPEIEERVDEKTRLQRAEELLLPSAPPQGEELMSSDRTPVQPSAPAAFDGNTLMQDPGQPGPSAPAYHRLPVAPQQNTTFTAPLIATSEERARAAADSHLEDKQELERRRLQAQASSPSADPVGNDALSLEASAPVLDEDTVVGHWPHFTGDEHTTDRLPRYQA
ncbi:MAG: hypothetical protein L6R39_000742 [Caloplaca ligustica]|nr:MAG: hypothetical protein L6R39_000742 [Caloplaca ligustica]